MPIVLRLLLIVAICLCLFGTGVAVANRSDAAAHSTVDRTVKDGWTVIRASVADGDALILRFSSDTLGACSFNIHTGPRQVTEQIRVGIKVDAVIVPADQATAMLTEMARPCAGYWSTTD